jgi:ABC-type transport system substrate-binding protein
VPTNQNNLWPAGVLEDGDLLGPKLELISEDISHSWFVKGDDGNAYEELYKQAESIAREEAPWLYIYHYTTHGLAQPYVKNMEVPFFGAYSLKYTKLDMEK